MGKATGETPAENTGKATKVDDIENDNVTPIHETTEGDQSIAGETTAFAGSPEPMANTEEKIAALESDILYLRAEFENYKRHAIQERASLLKYGAERLARDLLETVDIFSQAFAGTVTEENYQQFVAGIQMTHRNMLAALERHGIKEAACHGTTFDPKVHEALGNEPTDQYKPGTITRVFKAPFTYHDKLLRPGQVFVAIEKEKVAKE